MRPIFPLLLPFILCLAGFLISFSVYLGIARKKTDKMIKYQMYARIARLLNLVLLFVFIYIYVEMNVMRSWIYLFSMLGTENKLIMYLLIALSFSFFYFAFTFCTNVITGYIAARKWRGLTIPFSRQLKISSTTFIYIFMVQIAFIAHSMLMEAVKSYSTATMAISAIIAAFLVLLVMTLYPRVIALFYGIDRDRSALLSTEYRDFLAKSGLKIKKITVIRTSDIRMANAWVSGIGIYSMVITDYLLNSFTADEVKGVLSHETGHIKKRHLIYNYLFVLFWLFSSSLISKYISDDTIVYLSYMIFCLVILFTFISRRNEYQADNYAVTRTGQPEVFINALLRLGKRNWMPVRFKKVEEKLVTHPSIERRIARIRRDFCAETGQAGEFNPVSD